MSTGAEFALIRAVWMVLYFQLAGFALFVVYWFGGSMLRRWRQGEAFSAIDRLIVGMSVVALSTSITALLWEPGHYLQGLGRPVQAAAWGNTVAPVMLGLLALHLVGYLLHVAFVLDRQSWRRIALGALAWQALGSLLAWWIGAFGFIYR